ncbi:MAG: glycosyltransferase family 2 protein [bacterium]|nr:glycosyltransferase family 2 protein [bacterium]
MWLKTLISKKYMPEHREKIPATVRILTFHSEKIIRRALESVKDFAEILVLDSNSSDKALDIAREYGARIEKQFPDRVGQDIPIDDWPAVVNRGLQLASYDWVFYIDHDESLSKEALEEIRQIVTRTDIPYHIYRIPNRVIFMGREILYATPYPGYQPRLVNKKSNAYYAHGPHYHLIYDKNKYKMGTMKHPWYVYIDQKVEKLKKRFIILEAMDAKKQTWSGFFYWSVWRKLSTASKIFIKMVFMYLRHGFKNSLPFRMEFLRVQNKLLLFTYCVRIRIFGEDMMKNIPQKNQ